MKKLILAAVIVSLLLAGCNEGRKFTVWGLSAPNNDLTAMVGLENEKGTTEVGIVLKCLKTSEVEWGPQPDLVGAYLTFWLTQDVTIEDTPEPSVLEPWLEALHARPYARIEIVGLVRRRQRKIQPNWAVGSAFTMEELGNWALIVEYVDGDQVVDEVFIGGRLRF